MINRYLSLSICVYHDFVSRFSTFCMQQCTLILVQLLIIIFAVHIRRVAFEVIAMLRLDGCLFHFVKMAFYMLIQMVRTDKTVSTKSASEPFFACVGSSMSRQFIRTRKFAIASFYWTSIWFLSCKRKLDNGMEVFCSLNTT